MYLSLKEKILLGVIGLLILAVPTGSYYIATTRTQTTSKASDDKFTPLPVTSPREVPKTNGLKKSKISQTGSTSGEDSDTEASSSASENGSTETSVVPILGPILNFRLFLEARPLNKQAAKVFVGLSVGQPTKNPKYLLSFVVNVPDSGIYKGLSLAGLNEGTTYTAYLKGPAQIATSSAFVVNPTPTDLGSLKMSTGDVNEDNVIDTSDYNIVKAALGLTQTSSSWNPNLDFNLDKVINTLDLAVISKNLNKTGASGAWYSTNPGKSATQSATPSGGLLQNSGGPAPDDGYWMWVPGL